ncbi:MAG: VWA domain-containing protein [Firmicutes bacterium]|nr:VWA domain-containing protein [Bacillota bacterium]MCL5040300.1 VWA domain-containing protein [Bacillota bacterium]
MARSSECRPPSPDSTGGFLFSREDFFRHLEPSLRYLLASGQGFRLGETAVVSRKVHTLEPASPGVVSVALSADAGQTFYHRDKPGEVVHMDLFHELGEVDHRGVARAVQEAIDQARQFYGVDLGLTSLADYADVQTATGGGRVTGSLRYGQRASLRRAHTNHIHLTIKLAGQQAGLLVFLAAALERAASESGLQIRRVERVVNQVGGQGGASDLSDYQTDSDSFLKGSQAGGGLSAEFRDLKMALELAEEVGGVDELSDLLEEMSLEPAKRQKLATLARQDPSFPEMVSGLIRRGLLRRQEQNLELTEAGRRLKEFIELHRQELEQNLRRLLRKIPWRAGQGLKPQLRGERVRPAHYGYRRRTAPLGEGDWPGEIAVPETVLQAARTTLFRGGQALPSGEKTEWEPAAGVGRVGCFDEEAMARGPQWRSTAAGSADPAEIGPAIFITGRPQEENAGQARSRPAFPFLPLHLEQADLWVNHRFQQKAADICLLLDASASMAGPRLRAAKYLARHLVLSTRERVSVLTFQEKELRVVVPFSRSYARLEEGLRSIQPLGLTPLAVALIGSLEYLQSVRSRNPLLLLISDGMPTVPKWTVNPIQDALEAAGYLARGRLSFGCIGLQPNRSFLEDLVRRGNGTLYVVNELEKGLLVSIARQERERLRG